MKPDDLLADGVRALRESTDGTSPQAPRTRTQTLALAAARAPRRRRVALFVLPLAAAFACSAAWAAVTGHLPPLMHLFGGPAPTAAATVGARTASGTKGIAEPPAAAPSHAASIADSASTMQPPVPEIDASALRKATEPPVSPSFVAASRASAKRPVASQPPISAEEQSLYDTAHRSHFVDHDPAAAVRGWDAYLQAYPDGRFALEAQYNRAIALVRLGRRDAGRAALTPFARGAYGGYRRAEAQELLDALDAADGGGAAP